MPPSVDVYWVCFYLSAVVNNSIMNTGVQVSVSFFSSLGYKSEIAGTNGNSMFNFLGSHCTVFSQQLHHFTFLPATHKGFNFSTAWSTYYFPVIITINIEYDLILTEQITSGKILFLNTVTF